MTTEEIIPSGKFTQAQLEILRMFSKDLPENVWVEIKDLLSKYFMENAVKEMDKLFERNKWGDEKIKEWASSHMRTPYDKADL
jgi:hypothetical protein